LDVNKLVEFALVKIPIPLNMFLSALNKLANGFITGFYFASSLVLSFKLSYEGFWNKKNDTIYWDWLSLKVTLVSLCSDESFWPGLLILKILDK
jgi:hypothetical protein